jgi:hypothetical protein
LDDLIWRILQDLPLQEELAAIRDSDAFVKRLGELGWDAETIRAQMRDGYRGWLERWIF